MEPPVERMDTPNALAKVGFAFDREAGEGTVRGEEVALGNFGKSASPFFFFLFSKAY